MPAAPVLVYDGECGFCVAAAKWIDARWNGPVRPDAISAQELGADGLARLGLTIRDAARVAWWVEDGHAEGGHLAIARALRAAGGSWGFVGRVLLHPPARWVAWSLYGLVAANRGRLPGGNLACSSTGVGRG